MINEEKMDRTLLDLGFNDYNRGTAQLRTAIRCYHETPGPMTKIIYPAVAKFHGSTPARVERCMRHSIENAWLRGDGQTVHQVFGYSIDPDKARPTVGEFIARVARFCRED